MTISDPRYMLFAIVTARSHITNNMDQGSVLDVVRIRKNHNQRLSQDSFYKGSYLRSQTFLPPP